MQRMCCFSFYNIEILTTIKQLSRLCHNIRGDLEVYMFTLEEKAKSDISMHIMIAFRACTAVHMTFTLLRICGQFVTSISSASVEDYSLLRGDSVRAPSSATRGLLAGCFEPEKEGNTFLRNVSSTRLKCVTSQKTEQFVSTQHAFWLPLLMKLSQFCSYSRISQHFMEPEGSLSCSQEPSTGPYHETDQSNPYHLILSL
jgi:hypothetical protein